MFVVFVSTDKQVTKYCHKDFLLNVMTVGDKTVPFYGKECSNAYVKRSN